MLTLIARKDVTELVRDGRLYWAGGVVTLLLCSSLAVGWQRQQEAAGERAAAQTLDYDDWIRQGRRHPHDAAHQGMFVFKPTPPLSIVDPGIEPYAGSAIWLQVHRQDELKFRPAQDATGLQRFGNLSAAWVLQVLGPLLVIVLGFNAFAGERELGTLRQTLSLGISPRKLLWGKALALASSVGVLMLPGVVAAALAVWAGAEGTRADAFARLGGLMLGYVLYLGIAIFGVLAVSARAATPRLALIALLGIWIVGVVVAPRAMADLSRQWYPTPSRTTFNSSLDSDLSAAYKRAWQQTFGVSNRFGTEVPLDKWGMALQVDDQAGYGEMDRHFEALWATFGQQQRAQEWAGLIVPVLALRAYSMGIAGTDFAHQRDFSVAAERQRRLLQDLMSADLVKHADPLGGKHFEYQAGPELWATVPRFDYAPPPIHWALRHNWRSLLVLGAGLAMTLGLAHVAVPRRRAW